MRKRFIALFVIFAMLVPLTPAVAADDTVPRPTVEEILSEYHQKAFEAEAVGETATASTYSRSGSSGKTLEQETVDTLNAAGYEAYNVTAENFEALEAQLQTDFADMGLDPDGSYIIAISGEEPEDSTASGISPRAMVPVDPGESGGFSYTYNGKTYSMRYVTVTADDESELGRSRAVDLFTDHSGDELIDALERPIGVFTELTDYYGIPSVIGTTYKLLTLVSPNAPLNQTASLAFTGSANWTIKYTQIFDTQEGTWKLSGSVEYVTRRYSTTYGYYSSSSNQYEYVFHQGSMPTIYSDYYDDTAAVKEQAVIAFEYGGRYLNEVKSISFEYAGEVVMTHTRRSEGIGYEPG